MGADSSVRIREAAEGVLVDNTDEVTAAGAVKRQRVDMSDRLARILGHAIVDASALPAGAATETTLLTRASEAMAQAIRDRLPAAFTPGLGVKVGMVDALPAGAATIGKVDQGAAGAVAWPVSGVVAVSNQIPAVETGLAKTVDVQAVRDRLPTAFTPGGGLKVGVLDALPAGSATIGKVDQGAAGVAAWPVSGPLTDTQLRAVAVPVSGTVAVSNHPDRLTDAQLRATAVPVSGPLTDAQMRATAVSVSPVRNAFATLLKFEPAVGEELRREELTTDSYHGRAPDGTTTATAAWEVVRLYKDAAGEIVRARYRTGVAWDNRAAGWT